MIKVKVKYRGKTYQSQSDLAKHLNVSQAVVRMAKMRGTKINGYRVYEVGLNPSMTYNAILKRVKQRHKQDENRTVLSK